MCCLLGQFLAIDWFKIPKKKAECSFFDCLLSGKRRRSKSSKKYDKHAAYMHCTVC